jgi:acyl CoA:acetate/3-ketoacid CoA transferase
MEFTPEIAANVKIMDGAIFRPEIMTENNPSLFSNFGERD